MKRLQLSLALPGGHALGGFIWGVLDGLIADRRFQPDAISAVGVGAINAALVASHWRRGRLAARHALAQFWYDVAYGSWPVPVLPPSRLQDNDFAEVVSPFDALPCHPLQPLAELLQRHVDVEALRDSPIPMFTGCTEVEGGRLLLFGPSELSLEALLATVASPFSTPPMVLDERAYWGDGLGGNPPLYPLIYSSKGADLLLLAGDPPRRGAFPDRAVEVFGQVKHIATVSSLMSELRAMKFVNGLVETAYLPPDRFRTLHLHRLVLEPARETEPGAIESPERLKALHAWGREAAQQWLATHAADVGRRSTFDVDAFVAAR